LAAVIGPASRHLRGWLLVEHGWNQADDVQRMMSDAGFTAVETRRDLGGLARCTGGRTPF
jgi:release factor glutamine methyltransferase